MKKAILKFGYLLKIYLKKREETLKEQKVLSIIDGTLKQRKTVYLELGSGPKKGKDSWITIDLCNGCDIQYDLLKRIPFPDNSVDIIYSSHFLEHFYYKDILKILNECRRTLKDDGILSICVPNSALYINKYINNEEINSDLLFKAALNINSPIDYVNYIAYMDGSHKYMFDEHNLAEILKQIGFKKIKIRDFDETLDLKERKWESIYYCAVK